MIDDKEKSIQTYLDGTFQIKIGPTASFHTTILEAHTKHMPTNKKDLQFIWRIMIYHNIQLAEFAQLVSTVHFICLISLRMNNFSVISTELSNDLTDNSRTNYKKGNIVTLSIFRFILPPTYSLIHQRYILSNRLHNKQILYL